MKAYISISYSKRKVLQQEVSCILSALVNAEYQYILFVDEYNFSSSEEKMMMKKALHEIDECDILIAETSDKAIGIGIEAGYAKAKNKTVIYLRHRDASHSTTLSGLSDFHIIYNDPTMLEEELGNLLHQLKKPVQN